MVVCCPLLFCRAPLHTTALAMVVSSQCHVFCAGSCSQMSNFAKRFHLHWSACETGHYNNTINSPSMLVMLLMQALALA